MTAKPNPKPYGKLALWGKSKPAAGKAVQQSSLLENLIKVITVLLTAASVFIGVWEFNRQQASNDSQEFKRKIWEKRLSAYMELGALTAKMVTETDLKAFSAEAKQFDGLYWGKLPLFDDDQVESAMKNFRNKVKDHMEGIEDVHNPDILKVTGYELIKTCQRSLKASWKQLDE